MEKLHFIQGYSAESFDLKDISDPLSENLRSKSAEHKERFINNENSRKSKKNEEIES